MVSLRPLGREDLDAVHALISNLEVVRHMLFPVCTPEESERFLLDFIAESPSGGWRSIARAIVFGGELAGLCGVGIPQGAEEGEIWYLVNPACWGRGIATAAVRQLLAIGFGELGLHRIWASCLPENPGSARVLEKVGMRREGRLEKNLKIHGEWKSSLLYAQLAEEWTRTLHS